MNCEKCEELIAEGESYNHKGKTLCEDCYIGAMQPPKTVPGLSANTMMMIIRSQRLFPFLIFT